MVEKQEINSKSKSMIVTDSVQVIRSPLRYPGGKQRAVERIAKYFPAKFREYREPMVGGASVFFHVCSLELAREYWINDKFKELISFWQVVQNKGLCQKLMFELEALKNSFKSVSEIKDYFYKTREETPSDSYREAFLFFFFNRVTFSGTTRAGGFSEAASLNRFTSSSIERLKFLPVLLENIRITNFDFEKLIESPGKDVFIFLDPPYFTASKLYGPKGSLHDFDHLHLANLLRKTKHKFLITYDDCPEIRKLYSWAFVCEWQLQYGMNNCNNKKTSKLGNELFISNY